MKLFIYVKSGRPCLSYSWNCNQKSRLSVIDSNRRYFFQKIEEFLLNRYFQLIFHCFSCTELVRGGRALVICRVMCIVGANVESIRPLELNERWRKIAKNDESKINSFAASRMTKAIFRLVSPVPNRVDNFFFLAISIRNHQIVNKHFDFFSRYYAQCQRQHFFCCFFCFPLHLAGTKRRSDDKKINKRKWENKRNFYLNRKGRWVSVCAFVLVGSAWARAASPPLNIHAK